MLVELVNDRKQENTYFNGSKYCIFLNFRRGKVSTFRSLESLCDIYLCGSKKKRNMFSVFQLCIPSLWTDNLHPSSTHPVLPHPFVFRLRAKLIRCQNRRLSVCPFQFSLWFKIIKKNNNKKCTFDQTLYLILGALIKVKKNILYNPRAILL